MQQGPSEQSIHHLAPKGRRSCTDWGFQADFLVELYLPHYCQGAGQSAQVCPSDINQPVSVRFLAGESNDRWHSDSGGDSRCMASRAHRGLYEEGGLLQGV